MRAEGRRRGGPAAPPRGRGRERGEPRSGQGAKLGRGRCGCHVRVSIRQVDVLWLAGDGGEGVSRRRGGRARGVVVGEGSHGEHDGASSAHSAHSQV